MAAVGNQDPEQDAALVQETLRLTRAAHSGDQGAFGSLYERIAPALFTWAELRIRPGLRSHLDPQDVVQEVWCRAWRRFKDFDPESTPFRFWIFRIAKIVLLEAFRKLRNPTQMAAGPGPSTRLFALQNLPDSATEISRRVARQESSRLFLEWADSLEPDDKRILVGHGLEGETQAEVAQRIGLEREAVAKRWQRLKQRILQMPLPREFLAETAI